MCLSNMPDTRTLYGGRRCGNGYLEDGEECDCGEEEVSVEVWLERGETLHCCQSFRPSEGQRARSLPSCQHFLHMVTTDRLCVRCRQSPGGWSLWPLPLWATAQATDLPRGAPGGVLGPPAALSLLWRPEFTQPDERVKLTQMSAARSLKMPSSHGHGLAWRREAGKGKPRKEKQNSWMGLSSFGMSVEHTPPALSFLSETCFSEKKKAELDCFASVFLKDEKMLTLA